MGYGQLRFFDVYVIIIGFLEVAKRLKTKP